MSYHVGLYRDAYPQPLKLVRHVGLPDTKYNTDKLRAQLNNFFFEFNLPFSAWVEEVED